MTNKGIARRLKLTADLIELTGGNAFRARAYGSAARTVDRMDEAVLQLVERDEMTDVQGIGKGIAADITALVTTGSFETLDELVETLPPGLLDVLRVKGLGPKKARALWTGLGVTTLDDLEEMATTGRIAELDGFGKKSQDTILDNVHQLKRYRARRRYFDALGAVAPLMQALRTNPAVERAELAGDIRRRLETVATADLVVVGDADALRVVLAHHAAATDPTDGAFFAGTLPDGLSIRVFHAEADDFARAWWQRTGSAKHVAAFTERFGEPEAAADEAAIYERHGLAFVEPELREGDGELDAAADDALPHLITVGDLRGTLHNHSTYSDGAHTLKQMAEAARAMGLEYFGVCDHSRSLQIANGLSVERLREQADEVRQLNAAFAADAGPPFRIFHGSECDILRDGSLDYPDDVLAELDFVVASIHSHFNMTEDEATERLTRAAEHPHVSILGHLTGRLLLSREGYPVDHSRVIAACAAHGVAIEVNANPYRLDIDWRYVREATAQGVMIAINPDAHAVDGLKDVQWGVAVARKGWLTPAQCLNVKSIDGFAVWLAARSAATASA
ncbi:MAG: helix-hairpin-helix domain-containing protein [Rhodothermales bacterium]